LRRRKTRTRRRELGAAVGAALCFLSGCGGAKHTAPPPPPAFPRPLAAALEARSEAVAHALATGDSCRAAALAHALQGQTIAAINRGRVAAQLQEPLTGAVNDLAARITCVRATPPPQRPQQEEHGRGKHKGHGKKKHKDDE
jgi:hypothetical protein